MWKLSSALQIYLTILYWTIGHYLKTNYCPLGWRRAFLFGSSKVPVRQPATSLQWFSGHNEGVQIAEVHCFLRCLRISSVANEAVGHLVARHIFVSVLSLLAELTLTVLFLLFFAFLNVSERSFLAKRECARIKKNILKQELTLRSAASLLNQHCLAVVWSDQSGILR